jgi:hypothetical protein
MNTQGEFNFSAGGGEDGYIVWQTGRRVAAEKLARQTGLPLGHQVEVWLLGGIRLRGKLELREDSLSIVEDQVRHLELLVDHVSFTRREMESCVRLD